MTSSLRKKKEKLKAKTRSAFREWKYLKEAQDDFLRLFDIYQVELNAVLVDLGEYDKKIEEPKEEEEDPNVSHVYSNFNEEEELEILDEEHIINNPDWARKLYKKIAIQTHPDKTSSLLSDEESARREKIFKDAARCLKNKEYDTLLGFASELNIEIEIEDEEYLLTLKRAIGRFADNIDSKKRLVAWTWGELEGQIQQRKNFLFAVFAEIGETPPPADVVESYLEYYESDRVIDWKHSYLNRPSKKIVTRKIGTKPRPSVAQERKKQ